MCILYETHVKCDFKTHVNSWELTCHGRMPCPSTLITLIDFPITKRLEWFGQPAITFCSGWHDSLGWRTHSDDAQPRHAARPLSSYAVRAQPRPNLYFHTNACISTLPEL